MAFRAFQSCFLLHKTYWELVPSKGTRGWSWGVRWGFWASAAGLESPRPSNSCLCFDAKNVQRSNEKFFWARPEKALQSELDIFFVAFTAGELNEKIFFFLHFTINTLYFHFWVWLQHVFKLTVKAIWHVSITLHKEHDEWASCLCSAEFFVLISKYVFKVNRCFRFDFFSRQCGNCKLTVSWHPLDGSTQQVKTKLISSPLLPDFLKNEKRKKETKFYF